MKKRFSALLISAVVLSFAGSAFASVGITFSKTVPTNDGGEMTISAGIDDVITARHRHLPPPPPPPPPHHYHHVPPPHHHPHMPPPPPHHGPHHGPRPGELGRGPLPHRPPHVPPPPPHGPGPHHGPRPPMPPRR